jgi:peptide subunit release factor 1 (eRF1)
MQLRQADRRGTRECSLQPSSSMAKTSPALDTPLRAQLEKLAAYEPQDVPVLSLYLNLAPDQHGRDNYDAFVRKAFADHVKAFKENSAERASVERDLERISQYLGDEVNRSANSVAIFASAGGGELFETVQLDAPLDEHFFFVGSVPHLYPLVRLIKTRRSSMGGWSQARYQRHADNIHLLHVKEVVETLDRIVRADNIQHIILAGDDVVVPLLREQLPKHLQEKVLDVLKLEREAAEDEIIEATLEVMRHKDAETDAEHVQELIGAWQSNGLGVVGPDATLHALQMGQVEELLIAGTPQQLRAVQKLPDDAAPGTVKLESSAPNVADERQLKLAGELVTRAQQTQARVRFIEDPTLLEEFGGVGALLRFRI